ncbi:hypothetical protein ACHAP3_007154 [Botrytis cinerea]
MMVLSRRQRDPEMRSAEQHSPRAGVSQPHFQISPMITISLMMLSTIIEEELQLVIKPATSLAQQVDSRKDEVWSRFMSMDEHSLPLFMITKSL